MSEFSRPFVLEHLSGDGPFPFDVAPTGEEARDIARLMGLFKLTSLRLTGTVTAAGRHGWTLDGRLTGRAVQPCVVTLDPVDTRIDVGVARRYEPGVTAPEGDEVEIPATEVEPLQPSVDLGALALEELALALPDYPRTPGATLAQAQFSQPGVSPMTDADARPFAALAALREKLSE